jgi:hypothetical protein
MSMELCELLEEIDVIDNKRERMVAYHEWRKSSATESMRAYHESGHAVVARKLGIGVEFVSASPWAVTTSRRWSRMLSKLQADSELIDARQRNAMFSLAGPIAEGRFLNVDIGLNVRDDEDADITGAIYDIGHIARLRRIEELRGLRGKKSFIQREFHRLEAETARLVEQHWCAIQRVAEVLEQRSIGDERGHSKHFWASKYPRIGERGELDGLIAG